MTITFHHITDSDQLNILSGKRASYGNLMFSFPSEFLKRLKLKLKEKNAYQLFAKDEQGKFLGYLYSAETIFPDHLFIGELFVDPLAQGKGVGSALVQKAVEFAKQQNLKGVMTETEFENIPAQKLYEKCGFKKFDNPDWKEGITYQLEF